MHRYPLLLSLLPRQPLLLLCLLLLLYRHPPPLPDHRRHLNH
jgi:hypothetical protein